MLRSSDTSTRLLLTTCILGLLSANAAPLITGGRGNEPMENRGWPLGAEKVANLACRVAWWEGPPYGGGQHVFEYRSKDTAEFNDALKAFAAIRTPKLELIVQDGPHKSFMEQEQVDWTFIVWRPESWHSLYNNPKSTFPRRGDNTGKPVPPPSLHAYVGGKGAIVWEQVEVPPNVHVIDRRASAAKVKPVGGGMIHADVYDMATGQTIAGAEVTVAKRRGRDDWDETIRGKTDPLGAVEIQKIPPGRYEIRIRAAGYASRGQGTYNNAGNTYHEFVVELMRTASISGKVVDTSRKPIAQAIVTAKGTCGIDGRSYPCIDAKPATTDRDGAFKIEALPKGFAQLRVRAPSLYQVTSSTVLYQVPPGFWDPPDGIEIRMTPTGVVRGKVVGAAGQAKSGKVHVHIHPPGPSRVGQWGGSMQCNDDGSFEFKNVPPGSYLVGTNPVVARGGKDPDAKQVIVKPGKIVAVQVTHKGREARRRRPQKPLGRPSF